MQVGMREEEFGSGSESELETELFADIDLDIAAPAKELWNRLRRSKSGCLQVLDNSRVEVGFFRPCRRVPVRQEFAGGATTER